jgi:hypothetical protein
MKNLKLALFSILMALPLTALADHEEALIPVFIQAISIIVFLIFMLFIKVNVSRKGILTLVYIIVAALIWITIDQMTYRDNMSIINVLIAFGPGAAVAIVYILLLRNHKRNQRS